MANQLSSQKLGRRELGSIVLLSRQALLLHRDQAGRGLSLSAKWLSALSDRRVEKCRPGERAVDLPRPPHSGCNSSCSVSSGGPLLADKQADISLPETPAQGQHHKSWGGSKQVSQPANHSLASFFPPGAQLLCTRSPGARAWSIICSSAPDPSIPPGEEPPSHSTLAETTACFSPPPEAGV